MNDHLQLLAVGAGFEFPHELTRKQARRLRRAVRDRRFSASLVVDIGNTTDFFPSLANALSGVAPGVGAIVDLLHANTNTNVFAAGVLASGEVPLLIQTSDSTASGTFTDPTSGIDANAFPIGGKIASGGVFWVNSGTFNSGNSAPAQNRVNAAPLFASGGIDFACFQRPHRYARLISLSGDTATFMTAGFLAQKKLTGISGTAGGFSFSPGSGTITAV